MKVNFWFFLAIIWMSQGFHAVWSQEDSLNKGSREQSPIIRGEIDRIIPQDTASHSPGKAALYSAVLPGLGQIYNKKYWKVPIIAAAGGTIAYFIYWNNNRFLEYRDSFLAKTEGRSDEDPFPFISERAAQLNRDFFKRNRELLIIVTFLVHGLNIVDATVDAHLNSFDIGDDLSLKIEPYSDQWMGHSLAGISLKLRLK